MHLYGFRGLFALMLTATLALALIWPGSARAQQGVFIQIESHDALTTAEQRARAYAQLMPNVNAFSARTGLYAVALGPYNAAEAQGLLQQILAQGLVPRDSFVVTGAPYASQVYPVGANALAAPAQPVTGGAGAPVIGQATLPDPVARSCVSAFWSSGS